MTNFILGMYLMWFIVSLVIVLGDEFFGQSCHWSDWFGFIVCFPVLIFIYPVGLVIQLIKKIKRRNR